MPPKRLATGEANPDSGKASKMEDVQPSGTAPDNSKDPSKPDEDPEDDDEDFDDGNQPDATSGSANGSIGVSIWKFRIVCLFLKLVFIKHQFHMLEVTVEGGDLLENYNSQLMCVITFKTLECTILVLHKCLSMPTWRLSRGLSQKVVSTIF